VVVIFMAGGGGDAVLEEVRGDPCRGGVGGSVGAVDADHGVEVDQAAALVFGDLGVGQPGVVGELPHGEAGGVGEQAAQADGEPVPELAGVGLPEDRALVVVGLGVDRGAETGVVGVVPLAAAGARPGLAPGTFGPVVHRAEGGGGERGEPAGLLGHGDRHALAAAREAGVHQVVGVGGVPVGAGGAHAFAAVAARDEDGPAVVGEHGAGVLVVQLPGAQEPDRRGAAVDGGDLGAPVAVVGGPDAGDDAVVQGQHNGTSFHEARGTVRGQAASCSAMRAA
jgi:hypothetical protein